MVLEATIIVVDNSEHSRNGDYLPSRFEAQADAVNLIFSAKTHSNPESSVGLMSMGGAQPEVLTTLTTDFGKVLEGLHRTKIRGSAHFSTALNVAHLALKHRQNKSQHQRIIVFTCSPLSEDEKSLVKLAKRMKKHTINVDIVVFGDLDTDTVKKFEAFNDSIKNANAAAEENSHLQLVPPGPNLLSDCIVASPIIGGDGAGAGSAGGAGGAGGSGGGDAAMGGTGADGFELGFDPESDPELALALRMSMEEEERRVAREQREQQDREGRTQLETVPEGDGADGADGAASSAVAPAEGAGEESSAQGADAGAGAGTDTSAADEDKQNSAGEQDERKKDADASGGGDDMDTA